MVWILRFFVWIYHTLITFVIMSPDVKFQVPITVYLLIVLSEITTTATQNFPIYEQIPKINRVTPAKIREWQGVPAQVDVGLYIRHFQTFDMVGNNFIMDGIIWFQFDPALISLETISKFSFEKAELLYKSEPATKLAENKFFVRFDVRIRFSVNLDYRIFPFDNHRMSIVLENRFVPPSELVFISNKSYFAFAETLDISGWGFMNKSVLTGYTQAVLEERVASKTFPHSVAVFTIDLRNKGERVVSLVMFPLLVIFFISLFGFTLDPKTNPNLVLLTNAGTVSSLLSYRFIVDSLTPHVGYFLFSDQIYMSALFCAVLASVYGFLAVVVQNPGEGMALMRGWFYLFFIAVFMTCMVNDLYLLVA